MKRFDWKKATAGAAGLLLCVAPSAWGFGLGLAPMTVELDVRPGNAYRQVLTVGNVNPKKSLSLVAGVADWNLGATGQLDLMDPSASAGSPAQWVRFSPAAFNLEPGEVQQIRVDIDVPTNVKRAGDHRVAIVISTLLPPEGDRQQYGSGIWKRWQLASLFYLTIGPAQSDASLERVALDDTELPIQAVVVDVSNAGNRHARLEGDVHLRDAQGELTCSLPFKGVVLDGGQRTLRVPLAGKAFDALEPGAYDLELDVRSERGRVPTNEQSALPKIVISTQPAAPSPKAAPPANVGAAPGT